MVWGVLGTGARESVLSPAPEAFDGHVVGAVGAVEDELDAKFCRQFLNCFRSVHSQIIQKQHCSASSGVIFETLQELHEVAAVNAVLAGEVRYDVALAVDGSGYCYGLETDLLFREEDGPRLRKKPNFWFNLANGENTLIHVEDVLPALDGLQEASKAHQSTLTLAAQLARGQADVHAGHPLLDTHFSVQLSEPADGNLVIFELLIEVGLPLDQTLGAPL